MNERTPGRPDVVVDWRPPRRPRRRGRLFLLAVLAALFLGGGTALSYYVEALWFDSLGYAARLLDDAQLQAVVFCVVRGWSPSRCCTARFARSSHRASARFGSIHHQRPAAQASGRAGPQSHRAGAGARHRRRHRRRHDGRVDDLRAVLACAGSRRGRSIPSSGGRSPSICSRCRCGSSSPAGC